MGRMILLLVLLAGCVLAGCDSSNTRYYYVCLSPELNYKRGTFYGFIYHEQGNTIFVDSMHRQAIVPGMCMHMEVP